MGTLKKFESGGRGEGEVGSGELEVGRWELGSIVELGARSAKLEVRKHV